MRATPHRLTQAEVDDIVTLSERGLTSREIAHQIGVNHNTVARRLKALGLGRPRGPRLTLASRAVMCYSHVRHRPERWRCSLEHLVVRSPVCGVCGEEAAWKVLVDEGLIAS